MGFIQHAGREVGWEAVDAILTYGARLQRDAAVAGVDLIADNGAELKAVERAIFNAALRIRRENLLEETYKLLSEGKLNRVNAAKLVQDVLQENISVDAWRKAVDKWASDNGKPKLDLPHGRRSRTKPEN